MNDEQTYKQLLFDFNKAYKHVMSCSDKTNRDYWILTEWKASIDQIKYRQYFKKVNNEKK